MMIELLSESGRRDPFSIYDQLRTQTPVIREPMSGFWLLLDYDGVKRALQDHEAFSSAVSDPAARTSRWILFSDPPRQAKLRALVSKAFTTRAVSDLEPRIRQLSRELLAPWMNAGRMDLMRDYAVPLPLQVIAELLGVAADEWKRLREWSDVIMGLIHTLTPGPRGATAVESFAAAHQEMDRFVAVIAEERRRRPSNDLLTRLVHAEVDGDRLSQDDLVGFFQLLLLAGHETTTNLIGNVALCLFDHSDQAQAVKAQPALRPAAIEEVLRYRTPVQMMFRIARHDVEFGGQTIPAGSQVIAAIGSANRDPRQFPDAGRFDVTRQPNHHIAFGHGIHSCIGAPLARLEGRVALDDLLALQELRRADESPWEPREAFHVHGPARLPVAFAATF